MDAADYEELAGYWEISLKNQNLSWETRRSYLAGVRQFAAWSERQGIDPDLTLRNAEAYTASFLEAGRSSSTATARQLALRRFSAWLADQDPRDPP